MGRLPNGDRKRSMDLEIGGWRRMRMRMGLTMLEGFGGSQVEESPKEYSEGWRTAIRKERHTCMHAPELR